MGNFNINKFITCFVIGVILSGCITFDPVYRTSYSFIPPKSQNGRECANKCLLMKQTCQNSCNKSNDTQTANILINIGKEEKKEKPNSSDKFHESSSWEMDEYRKRVQERARYERCQNSCNYDHRLCHTNCGGEVIVKTMCVQNCNEEKK
ncbi:hypothetical protein ACJZTR_02095 [Neorickettsia risticii]|nr:hypothetical protein [Neorickettsia risticii]